MTLNQQVLEEQDEISRIADLINEKQTDPWKLTAELKHSISRVVCVRLAENRKTPQERH